MFKRLLGCLVLAIGLSTAASAQQPRLPTAPPEDVPLTPFELEKEAARRARMTPLELEKEAARKRMTPLERDKEAARRARMTPLELEKEAARKARREAISEGMRKAEESELERAKRTKEEREAEEARAKSDSMLPERFVRPLPGMARPSTAYDLPSSAGPLPSVGGSRSLRDQTFVKPFPNQTGWVGTILFIRESALPLEARQTLQLIRKGGPFPYTKDGTIFGNRERRLPMKARGYYREYTVPTPGSEDRGARRIVAGAAGEYYYTADHYRSFKLVRYQ